MEDVLCVEGLSKSYQSLQALHTFSAHVAHGEVFGLLGANGAGKTTAIECILGIRPVDEGKIQILGLNPRRDRKKLFQNVGVQFQEGNYQNLITVRELCTETASLYKEPADWKELLKKFGLAEKEKANVKDLSGGQRQRLFIVLALIPNPEIVFLDELTTGLDVKARRSVWKILEELKKGGMTILLTSHFMDEVEALCDRICILKKGEIVFCGTVQEAIAQSPYDRLEDAYLWYSGEEEDDESF